MRNLLLLIGLCSGLALSAQTDKVYLKNGSLLRGHLLDVNNNYLSLDIGENEPLQLSLNNLRFIRAKKKDTRLSAEELTAVDSLNKAIRVIKLMHQLRLGVINGEDGSIFNTVTDFSADYTLYYPAEATWWVGVSIGYDEYLNFRTFPVSIALRKNWGIGPSPFFTYVRAGISRTNFRQEVFDPSANVKGQEMFAMGIGQQWSLGKLAMVMTAGYRTQSLQTTAFRSTTEWNLNRLEFKVGVVF